MVQRITSVFIENHVSVVLTIYKNVCSCIYFVFELFMYYLNVWSF